MKKRILTLLAAVSICACQSLLPEKVDIVTLGILPESITVPATAGEDGVRVIADRDYSVEILSGQEWLTPGISKSDTLSFSFKENAGFRRSAVLKINADGREDRLVVKQEGPYKETLTLSTHSVTAPADGCQVVIRVLSNLPSDYFTVTASNDNVISKLRLTAYELSFVVLPTTNRDKRNYTVTVSYTDGWGETIEDSVNILQEVYD